MSALAVEAARPPATRARRTTIGELGVLAVLMVWGLGPTVWVLVHAAVDHLRLTGAQGVVAADQLQYLAWVRDAANHGLASDLFVVRATGHVYLQPLFEFASALMALGASLPVAAFVLGPPSVLVLFAGVRAWTRRMFPDGGGPRLAALWLALFFNSPLAVLLVWGALGSPVTRIQLGVLIGEMFPGAELWGYFPSAFAIALVPATLLLTERAQRAWADRPHAGVRDRRVTWPLAGAGACGLFAAWLHPWQAPVLALILVGLTVWDRGRGWRVRVLPVISVVIPLLYYEALSRRDWAWHLAAHNDLYPHDTVQALAIGVLLPIAFAIPGLRRPGADPAERALLLWVAAALVVYVIDPSYPTHAFESMSLPLAVLWVRGFQRLAARVGSGRTVGRRGLVGLGILAIGVATVPGMLFDVRAVRDTARSPVQQYWIDPSTARALAWLRRSAPAGGVLAPTVLGIEIPSQTGRRTWVGQEFWSIDYNHRQPLADALFTGELPPATARELVRSSGARVLVSDCVENADLTAALAPILASVHRFGCARAYVVRSGAVG